MFDNVSPTRLYVMRFWYLNNVAPISLKFR